ncbi:uncharacterized protein AB675_5118 [Cyphellophora attinorum]|uniref:PX domain-containing protein n=1 Tax=Cyphellophora attinorum TaxID=1664694 RepID=A0A0N0NLR0_9EURO|nr:uncharacterized protein AB675_5118 [Phialophora attinorum]KPI39468.1 hypothetical protein AB675_5118 [Phialophora attinorum]
MATTLSPGQSAALFDILSHYDTYQEIRDFRNVGSLAHYGPPFTTHVGQPSTAPALQTLVTKYLLTLPGLRDLPGDWWKVQCHDIIENFEKSNLSESYDKGSIGSRKTLATAISALIEYPVRGTFGGFAEVKDSDSHYDISKADDLARAFRDFMDGCIYGTALEETVMKASETDDLSQHSSLIKGVHEFVLVNVASLMHYTLVLSPKGQYLLKLIENANKLIPYLVIRQTLKIGNVASMISAMMRVVLAKMSVTSVTNWIGLTSNADDGMNLLQHIVSTVLHWDTRELDSRASKIEKERGKSAKEQLQILKEYPSLPREEQERIRSKSQKESISIVTAIFRARDIEHTLNEHEHEISLEYLSIQLSIRDRQEIIRVLCHTSPDYFTKSIRELVDAYYPVIRDMHNAINLSGTISDMESFIRDMIKVGKIQSDSKGNTINPSVGDFVMLLRKHQFSCHTFIHQACKNGPELVDWYLGWAKGAAAEFKRAEGAKDEAGHTDAGKLNAELNKLFESLTKEQQKQITPVLDAQIEYLDEMHASSRSRLEAVLHSQPSNEKHIASVLSGINSRPSSRPASRAQSPAPQSPKERNAQPTHKDHSLPTPKVSSGAGPGAFLSRWQDILDHTPISPLTSEGKVQKASSTVVVNASTKDVDGQTLVEYASKEAPGNQVKPRAKKPDARIIVDCMGVEFRRLLAEKSCSW